MAFRDAMEIGCSSSMSWRFRKRNRQKRGGSIAEGSPESDTSPPALEEGNISDISMVDDSLLQHDSDVDVKEREENMDTGAPASSMAPMPLRETPMWESFEAGDPDDYCSQTSEESMDQNPPHDLDLDEDKLLGMVTNLSIPGGHSDDCITLIISPWEDDL